MVVQVLLSTVSVLCLSLTALSLPLSRQVTTIGDQSDLHPALLNLGATWPVPAAPAADISSTFGVRRFISGRYDFHRGVDISAPRGTPVVSVLNGTFYKRKTYSGGGITAIIDYPVSVDFHGQIRTRMTAYYMHLDSYSSDILTASRGDDITEGQVIGYVGDSGSASTTHLHFEIRVGSRCSLEFQLANPTSSCATLGHDPHVHPLGLFPGPTAAADHIQLSVVDHVTATQDGIVEVSSVDDFPVANRYELFRCESSCAQRTLIAVLDYSLREGFDASSTSTLDDDQTSSGKPRINPLSFGRSADTWRVQYVIPAGFSTKAASERFQLVVTDVYDDTFTIFTDVAADSW